MLVPPLVEYGHALLTVISLTDAITTSDMVIGGKRERLQVFRRDAARVLAAVVGVEAPSGQIADVNAGGKGK